MAPLSLAACMWPVLLGVLGYLHLRNVHLQESLGLYDSRLQDLQAKLNAVSSSLAKYEELQLRAPSPAWYPDTPHPPAAPPMFMEVRVSRTSLQDTCSGHVLKKRVCPCFNAVVLEIQWGSPSQSEKILVDGGGGSGKGIRRGTSPWTRSTCWVS